MKRILVVDDEPSIRELIADFLRETGYLVETAANGAEALERMHQLVPHAIVLDLMMPQLDATGFVELKRRNPRFAQVPILLMTADFGAFDAAERLGTHACLTKPFELDDLAQMVGRLIANGAQMPLPSSETKSAQAASEVAASARSRSVAL